MVWWYQAKLLHPSLSLRAATIILGWNIQQCDSVLLQSSLSLKAATIILGWDSVIVGSLVVGTHGCISRNTGLKSDVVGKFKYKEKWTRDQGMRIRIR